MFFYNLLIAILFCIAYPFIYIFLKGKERQQRLGNNLPQEKDVIWIHAASVGEVNAVRPFINELAAEFPHEKIVISTLSKTGQNVAAKISEKIKTFFFPIDSYYIMRKVFRKLQPKLIIIVETELWPNLLFQAKKKQIPVEIINARISDNSFNKYNRSKIFWRNLISNIVVNAKSEIDAERFRQIGFKNVINAHNLKFCSKLPHFDITETRKELGFNENDNILVWGSSRPGEEQLLQTIRENLTTNIQNLKFVIVPRHLSRVDEIKKIFPDCSLSSERQLPGKVHIVDEMGVLTKYYAIANLAIIGGSFFDFGGHNPLEAAYYGIPTIIGNYHHSCRDSVEILAKHNGIKISTETDLYDDIIKNFKTDFGKELGENGRKAIEQNLESMKINISRTKEILSDL